MPEKEIYIIIQRETERCRERQRQRQRETNRGVKFQPVKSDSQLLKDKQTNREACGSFTRT